jgi:hypothetical protein
VSAPKFQPIIIDTTAATEPEEMLELFVLDGRSYSIPSAPRVAYAMSMLDDLEEFGAGIANMRLLRRLLGEDAYRALAGFDRLTKEQLGQVADAAMRHTVGGVEDVAGN